MDWLTDNRLPLRETLTALEGKLDLLAGSTLAKIAGVADRATELIANTLQIGHPLVIGAILAALTLAIRRKLLPPLLVLACVALIANQGYWPMAAEALAVVIPSVAAGALIGIPLGLWLGHLPAFARFLQPVLRMLQFVSVLVFLAVAFLFWREGSAPLLVAAFLVALPAQISLTARGIAATPASLVEAADAFGANGLQRLIRVELPVARHDIQRGLCRSALLALCVVALGGLIAAGGPGKPVLDAFAAGAPAHALEGALMLLVLAVILDLVLRPRETPQ